MRNKTLKILSLLAALFAGLVIISVVYAQERIPTDDDVLRVAKKLYCPVCPNTPLDVCETKACQDWRAQIRDQLTRGWTEQQIIDYFVAQYGERVLAEPQRKGFTSLVWFLPLIVVLVGLGVVVEILRNWRKQKPVPVAAVSTSQIPAAVLKKIESEIQEMD